MPVAVTTPAIGTATRNLDWSFEIDPEPLGAGADGTPAIRTRSGAA